MDKQPTGFKFGKYRTTVIRICGEVEIEGYKYKLVYLKTGDELYYYSLRLYNRDGRFIKQFLFPPGGIYRLIALLLNEAKRKGVNP